MLVGTLFNTPNTDSLKLECSVKEPQGKQSHEDKLVLLHDSCTTLYVLYTYRYCANVNIYMHEYMYVYIIYIYDYMYIYVYIHNYIVYTDSEIFRYEHMWSINIQVICRTSTCDCHWIKQSQPHLWWQRLRVKFLDFRIYDDLSLHFEIIQNG